MNSMNNTNIMNNTNDKILPISFLIKSGLSFRYISNLSIIISILAYYMNAYEILFIFAPLLIVNCIIICYILFTNLDDLMCNILITYLPEKEDRDKYKLIFVTLVILWHILPIVWLFYILDKDNLIKLFRPNFMGIYFKSILIPIIYYYYESNEKVYGNINYLMYFICYIILLLTSCIYLYLE